MKSIQLTITPSQGKKLIADALCSREDVQYALKEHTVVIIKGTTNAYLAENLLKQLGADFTFAGFNRGIIVGEGAVPSGPMQKYDVIITKGQIVPEKTIFDVAASLTSDDIIFKGCNAVNLDLDQAGILIGDPNAGTILPIMAAAAGRRTTLIHPVGVEKRVELPIDEIADLVNDCGESGCSMFPTTGIPYTELDAFADLFDCDAEIIAAGGVAGAEGCCMFRVEGEDEDIDRLDEYAKELKKVPLYPY